jgi:hypothetical protein
MKVLFIGNSATSVHQIPKLFEKLCNQRGLNVETDQIIPSSFTLAKHADTETEHGVKVLETIQNGYDFVVLQENTNCIADEEKSERCKNACKKLSEAIKNSGAKVVYYVRPPVGYEKFGSTPVEQCQKLDLLFSEIADETDGICAYVNRAFEIALTQTDIRLHGPDNAHTSEYGAYLVACVIISTITGLSPLKLDFNELDPDKASVLQKIAQSVVSLS